MPSFHDFFARDEDKNMVLEFCNGLGGGHYFREGMPFLTANAKAVGLPRKIFVEGLKNAPGELADYWKESLSNREIAELTRGPKRPSDDAATTNPSKKVMLTKSEIAVATAAEPSHVAPKEVCCCTLMPCFTLKYFQFKALYLEDFSSKKWHRWRGYSSFFKCHV